MSNWHSVQSVCNFWCQLKLIKKISETCSSQWFNWRLSVDSLNCVATHNTDYFSIKACWTAATITYHSGALCSLLRLMYVRCIIEKSLKNADKIFTKIRRNSIAKYHQTRFPTKIRRKYLYPNIFGFGYRRGPRSIGKVKRPPIR